LRIRIGNGLLPLNLLVFGLVAVTLFFPWDILRIVLGVPFLLFFPGYALMAVLFPKQQRIDGIERVALSFGTSIAVVVLIGLILNYTPWGIRLEPILYAITLFILITSIVGWLRWKRLTEQERFSIELQLKVLGWGKGVWNKTLYIMLVIAILGALGAVGYVIAHPEEEKFTEFYTLGPSGKATVYPRDISVGEEVRVIVGIVNHEHKVVSYRIEVRINGVKNTEVKAVELANEQQWEEIVSFTPNKAGDNQKVEFLLFKNGETEPSLNSLHLWVNVTE